MPYTYFAVELIVDLPSPARLSSSCEALFDTSAWPLLTYLPSRCACVSLQMLTRSARDGIPGVNLIMPQTYLLATRKKANNRKV